jgi:hypothetical protein
VDDVSTGEGGVVPAGGEADGSAAEDASLEDGDGDVSLGAEDAGVEGGEDDASLGGGDVGPDGGDDDPS